nr:Ger(x)C family spore germination protein [Paenibacillus artemisiicola]
MLAAPLALLLLVPLAGCWDRRELNELAISLALGIDKAERGYRVTLQVVQPGQVASKMTGTANAAPVTVYETNGTTIYEAVRRMTTVSPRHVYGAHLRVAVFGEELAREGLGDALDLLSRDYEFRTDFYLLVAKGATAARALNLLFPLERIPANKIYGSIQTAEKVWAPVRGISLDEFITDAGRAGKNPVLSGIQITGDERIGGSTDNVRTVRPAADLRDAGFAAFRKDRLVGWLDEEESRGYNALVNRIMSTVGHVPCPRGGNAALEVVRSKAKLTGTAAHGRARLGVDLRLEENIGEVQCRLDLTRAESIRALERAAGRLAADSLRETIESAQKRYKSDIFGFGEAIHRSSPGTWRSIRDDWDELFAEAGVDVSVTVKIKRTGTLTNAYKEKEE